MDSHNNGGEYAELTQQELKSLLNYNPDTGVFTWRIYRSNRVKEGMVAGCCDKRNGYRRIGVNGKLWLEHQLCFLYMVGTVPKEIDHVDNIKSNNKWGNLRECDRRQNQSNKSKQKRNTTGVKGVSWFNKGEYYVAQFQVNYSSRSKLFRPRDYGSKENALIAAKDWVVSHRSKNDGEFANNN